MEYNQNPNKNGKRHISKKTLLIIIFDILFVIGVVFIALKTWQTQEKIDRDEIHTLLYSSDVPNVLKDFIAERCNVDNINLRKNCFAMFLQKNGFSTQARNICEAIESIEYPYLKNGCIASVIAEENITEGIKICNEMNSSVAKNLCTVSILPKENDTTIFCNNIEDSDWKQICVALSLVKENKTSLETCREIENTDKRNLCIEFFKPFED